MGEVYRGRDRRLRRDVALKVLLESFMTDPNRLARFQREAEVLAALNHPHIAQIHGVEESDGARALVLEFVDGLTLAERIGQGTFPLDESVPIARQIAEAPDPARPVRIHTIDVSPLGGSANSVDVARGILAVAVEAKVKTDPGLVAFYSTRDYRLLGTAPVGALPDMVTFTLDGRRVLVANEGEPSAYEEVDAVAPVDPEGSVSIVDIGHGCARPRVRTADFRRFNGRREALVKAGVRLFGPGATVAQDLEPEFIAVSGDEAFVTLQENNALAIVDIDHARVKSIVPLGTKDHSKAGNGLDASDRDGKIDVASWPVKGMYQPDGIAAYRFGGRTFLVTANEGDARDYAGLAEEVRVGSSSYKLDPTAFPNASDLKKAEALGRLTVTNRTGDTDGDGDFDEIHAFGARSFSIWDAATGRLVYDSGQDLEEITARLLPAEFNSNHEENGSFDTRSDNKGPEPEGVVLGLLVGNEISGTTTVYEVAAR